MGLVNSARDPQISLFSHFFIKNRFHSTVYTFKNYFATVFSIFSFNKISFIQTDPFYNPPLNFPFKTHILIQRHNIKRIKMLVWRQFFTPYQLARKALPIYHRFIITIWIPTKAHFESPPRLNAYSRWISQRSQRLGVKKQVVALMVYLILDLDFYFCMILDGFWLFLKKRKRKITVLRKLIWVLNSGWIPFCVMSQWSLSSLSLKKKPNKDVLFSFHFSFLFVF